MKKKIKFEQERRRFIEERLLFDRGAIIRQPESVYFISTFMKMKKMKRIFVPSYAI